MKQELDRKKDRRDPRKQELDRSKNRLGANTCSAVRFSGGNVGGAIPVPAGFANGCRRYD
jgi:hypothetical protein